MPQDGAQLLRSHSAGIARAYSNRGAYVVPQIAVGNLHEQGDNRYERDYPIPSIMAATPLERADIRSSEAFEHDIGVVKCHSLFRKLPAIRVRFRRYAVTLQTVSKHWFLRQHVLA